MRSARSADAGALETGATGAFAAAGGEGTAGAVAAADGGGAAVVVRSTGGGAAEERDAVIVAPAPRLATASGCRRPSMKIPATPSTSARTETTATRLQRRAAGNGRAGRGGA
jgi:hypothetical protein